MCKKHYALRFRGMFLHIEITQDRGLMCQGLQGVLIKSLETEV